MTCHWDHSTKPSKFVVKKDNKEIYRGTFKEGYKLYQEWKEQENKNKD
jgi:hypothetical protein